LTTPFRSRHNMYGMNLDESDEDEEFSGDSGWIPWFCGLKGHELLAEVEEEYIRDNFNLYGLRGRFQSYDQAFDLIVSNDAPDEDDLADPEYSEILREATNLYGLIHARYIGSPRGLQVMREKYLKGVFGTCPRVLCDRQHVLPIDPSENIQGSEVKIFCPKCEQMFSPKGKQKDFDGAFFGSSFPQIFLQSYPALVPLEPPRPFASKVFGFKLHHQKSLITQKLEDEANDVRASSAAANLGAADRPARDAAPEQVEGNKEAEENAVMAN